jgi:hypothetical protein
LNSDPHREGPAARAVVLEADIPVESFEDVRLAGMLGWTLGPKRRQRQRDTEDDA